MLVYAANEVAPEHPVCRDQLERWRRQEHALVPHLSIVTHARVFPTPWSTADAWGFLRVVLAAPGARVLTETNRHAAILDEVVGEVAGLRGNLLHDAHIATVMREHGVRTIVTRDTDFHRFGFLHVVDPLEARSRGS